MKITVIGGTGLMGPSLVQQLVEAGDEVCCINRSGVNPVNTNAMACDRHDEHKLRDILSTIRPDLLIDMIPYTAKEARSLSTLIRKTGTPLLAISSIDVYKAYNVLHKTIAPNYQACPLKEGDELRTQLSFEGLTYDKLNVERIYLETLKNVTLFRMPAIYGWPDTSRIAHYVDFMLQNSRPMPIHPGYLNWKFSRALNKNCAFAITLAKTLTGQHIYNVAEEKTHTEQEWFAKIASHLHWEYGTVADASTPIPYNLDPKQHWFVSSEKIREELGFYEKYDPETELSNTIQMYLDSREKIELKEEH